MEHLGLLLLLVAAFLFVFDDETKKFFGNDKKGTSEVHETEPEETKSGKPKKTER
ncbi:MAG: hypothetical protein M0P69_12710 [Bacteroidales bacterium]|jgi:ABC-type cobalt transport system substrate-binding protein|nr:hypothetical protein [Bacteroidales bacterium]